MASENTVSSPTNGTPPKFAAVPLAALPAEATDSAPKRRGRKPRDPNVPVRPRRSSKSLETQIGAMLITFNFAFMVVPPLRNDALDDAEITTLAKAIDQQAKTSPTFRRYLVAMLNTTSGGQLVTIAAIIGARRLARHEIGLPKEADTMLGTMLANMANVPFNPPVLEPEGDGESDQSADDAARE